MKFKKIVIIALIFALCFSVVACSGGGGTESTSSEGDANEKVTLKLNHVGATTHPYHLGSEKFAQLVNEKSMVVLKFKYFLHHKLLLAQKQ